MGTRGAVFAALVSGCAAQAQNSVNDYQLPPQPTQATPPVQGPVDTENPAARAPSPQALPPSAPSPRADGDAAPAPRITLPATLGQPERTRPQRTPSPARPATAEAPAPTAEPTPAEPPAFLPEAQPTAAFTPAPATEPAAASQALDWRLPALLALLALGAFLLLRRRKRQPEANTPAEAEASVPAAPAASAPAALTPLGQSTPKPSAPKPPAPKPPAPLPADGAPFGFGLEPQSLRLSVVYATLAYQLRLANRGDAPIAGLRIAGDMISAHASIPAGQQLSLDGAPLQPLHEVAMLAPGEEAELKGELRLPLAEVLGLRAGAAILFAPLARFLCEGDAGFRAPLLFSIGQPSDRPGGTMQPFRVDLGPMLFREVEQRAVNVSRWLPLDEVRQAG